jgi:hypothetical protein
MARMFVESKGSSPGPMRNRFYEVVIAERIAVDRTARGQFKVNATDFFDAVDQVWAYCMANLDPEKFAFFTITEEGIHATN